MLGLDGPQYFNIAYQTLMYPDVLQGLVKPVFFGFIIASIGCYFGMKTRGGTQGVGKATTQAVVFSSVLIIVVDFLISRTMIGISDANRMPETTAIAEQPSSQPEQTGPVVVFEHVSIAFEDNQVLNDISFAVEPGETRIVLGPAGCGKSVLMKLATDSSARMREASASSARM